MLQEEWNQLFKDIAGVMAALRRTRDAARTLTHTGVLVSRYRDECDFFPPSTLPDDFRYVEGLMRGLNYSQDGILHLRLREITPGVTFELIWLDPNDNALAYVTGNYNEYVDISPQAIHSPTGLLRVHPPTVAVTDWVDVEIEICESAALACEMLIGTGADEIALRNAAQSALQTMTRNFEGVLYEDIKRDIWENRLMLGLVKRAVGSTSDFVFAENAEQNYSGAVRCNPTGVLVDLADLMITEGQTIKKNTVSAGTPQIVGVGQGALDCTVYENAMPGAIILRCAQGFSDAAGIADPETFVVHVISPQMGIGTRLANRLRINQAYESLFAGVQMSLERATSHTAAPDVVQAIAVTQANTDRIPLQYLDASFSTEAGVTTLTIVEPRGQSEIYHGTVTNGTQTIQCVNGLLITMTLDVSSGPNFSWTIQIHPFERGDYVRVSIANDMGGRFQSELMQVAHYFLPSSDTPTINDTYLPPEFPFVPRLRSITM